LAEILAQSFRELRRVGALLKTNDHTVAQSPNMCESRLEGFSRRFRPRRISADGDHAVPDLKKLRRLGSPLLKIAEQRVKKSTTPLSP
jgi:hypothetical protein